MSPGIEPVVKLLKKQAPRGILDSRVNESGSKVFGWEVVNGEAQNTNDGPLNDGRSVKEKKYEIWIY